VASTIEQVLGYVNLTGTIQVTTTGIPDPLPQAFHNIKRGTLADIGRYTRVTGTRTTSQTSLYGSPSRRYNLKDVGVLDVKLLHSFEHIVIDAKTFAYLRSKDSYQVDQAKEEVGRQINEFGQRFDNLRIAAAMLMLSQGNLYFDSLEGGNLLASSSNALLTLSAGVPAGNQTQLNVFGSGNILDLGWQNPAADIRTHVNKVKQAALQLTGYPIRHAFYGLSVPTNLAQNDHVLDYLARNPAGNNEYVTDGEVSRLFGIQWHPMYEGFFTDQNATNQTIWDPNLVVFTPEPNAGWWQLLEGTYDIPTNINVQSEGVAAFDSLKRVQGKFGYSLARFDPPGATSFFGDTFLYILKNPSAVFQAATNF